ncbi:MULTISPECIES: DNA-binding response regulator [Pseudoalteromonas]|jgi:two-component system response regulator DesR|uniref:response regulator transcription factor n=1 Tax=Pseudoalteromonas TaxID=53246 RepID=UPI0006CA45D4|nr:MULTISPECIES: response regulator transcription factor [unclassified Pseudoalteromonas]MBU76676.1 DNA-binding response regulator [Pseudoalteromonadaceae bacterium]MEC8207158.1 response regulator transcription factor [Pseudomonadota bacterium]KPM80132.1 transcriptional regulator [Pseudoalteromonas sp. UCD-33C]KPV98924.1 Transcriptional regulatory protein DegU [Pseudoalteromonas sp. P1-8]KPZ74433.1 Transcriptional regulatory protein DegU [Pseudoalteromonas sp. P1-26]|tara:strand:- start:30 stop:632 length:603 start_codon:yes stop_codon:yes gene_type:complete
MINLLIVEDQQMVREAISALVGLDPFINVVGQAEDGKAALKFIEQNKIDMVLSDIEMPNMSGIELVEILSKRHSDIKTMIITTFSKAGYIKRAMKADVRAFILKEAPSEHLINAIKSVNQGRRVIDPELALLALSDTDPLTNKERKALKLAGDGLKTQDIAKTLFLSEGTVRNYLSEAMSKLNAVNRVDAARIARQKGWL